MAAPDNSHGGRPAPPPPAVWPLLLALLAVALLLAGLNVRQAFGAARQQGELRLQAQVDLMGSEIDGWLAHLRAATGFLTGSTSVRDDLQRWQVRGDPAMRDRALVRVEAFAKANDVDSVLLLDASGALIAPADPAGPPMPAVLREAVRQVVAVGQPTFTGLYRPPGAALRLDLVVPLFAESQPTTAVVVLRIDPARVLLPRLQALGRKPVGARLRLWQRQGDQVLVLDNAGLRPDTGPSAGDITPWLQADWPAARAMRGDWPASQVLPARDDAGLSVLATARPVAGLSAWLVGEIDETRVLVPAWQSARGSLMVAALLLMGMLLAGRIGLQRRRQQRRDRADEQARLQALGLLKAIADGATDAIFAKDLQGRYLFYNRAAGRSVGLDPAQVLGRSDVELFGAELGGQLAAHDSEVIASGRMQQFEEVLPGPQGDRFNDCTKGPLHDDAGRLIGVFGSSHDITERRQLQHEIESHRHRLEDLVAARTAELQDSNRQLADSVRFNLTLTDALPGRVAYWDTALRCRFCNKGFTDWLGRTREAVLGQPLETLFGAGFMAAAMPRMQAALRGDLQRFERETRQPDGSVKVDLLHYLPDRADNGTVRGLFVMSIDITPQKRAEAEMALVNVELERSRDQAQAASRAKSAFLANMSHEIRTPMNAIIGLTHLLARDSSDALQRERLAKVDAAARHLLQVINNILDLSKIEVGKMTLEATEFSLDSLLSHCVDMVRHRAAEQNLELVLATAGLPARLRGDATRLSQLLINLLGNAVKFTASGWVRLGGVRLPGDGRRLRLRFEVQDTGEGIAAEHQATLFDAFEQGDSSITRRHGGTGLGLSLVRHLAQMMGGEVGLHSTPGQGSCFWFTVTLDRAEAPPSADAPALQGLRVLLVDDLAASRDALQAGLQCLGLQVEALADGVQAVEQARRRQADGGGYDLLLVDWQLGAPPDGVETLQRLRTLLGEAGPPALLLCSQDDPVARRHARAGGWGLLLKPVTLSALRDGLVQLLQGQDQASPAALRGATASLLRDRHGGQRVLLVEDNPVNLEVAVALLESAGLVVTTARNGLEAIGLLRAGIYDLVLMDIQMPEMDGLAATRTIRGQLGATLPIVAMTANAFGADRADCLAAGMNDHVAKPVDLEDLYATLLRWLPAAEGESGRKVQR